MSVRQQVATPRSRQPETAPDAAASDTRTAVQHRDVAASTRIGRH